jgi:UDP-N-acetylmuramyl pentapeptide phosphotransferase/UDP-N-acetylglucosamine-1-phosphate transferase
VAISPLALSWWLVPVAVFAATAVINFVNFSDGLDGLVAGCAAVLLTVAVLALPPEAGHGLLPLIGALLSFLAWNWSPARVFMGDVGSTFLGAVIAGMVLVVMSAVQEQHRPGDLLDVHFADLRRSDLA